MTLSVELSTPEEYFREQLQSAVKSHKVNLCTDLEYYLVHLLCNFISPKKIVVDKDEYCLTDVPLALILKKAVEAEPAEKEMLYRTLGDASLYVSGFFQNFFNRKTVDLDYFVSIGSAAYFSVSSLSARGHQNKKRSELFENLANNFHQFVDLVSHISENFCQPSNEDLLALYNRWMSSGSSRLFNKLKDHGIVPCQVKKDEQ